MLCSGLCSRGGCPHHSLTLRVCPEGLDGEQTDFVLDCCPESRDDQHTYYAIGTELENLEKMEKLKQCIAVRARRSAFQFCP